MYVRNFDTSLDLVEHSLQYLSNKDCSHNLISHLIIFWKTRVLRAIFSRIDFTSEHKVLFVFLLKS